VLTAVVAAVLAAGVGWIWGTRNRVPKVAMCPYTNYSGIWYYGIRGLPCRKHQGHEGNHLL
jgi:hypothetical protein